MADIDLFVSYHWRDHERVETLARELTAAGLKVFLDRWYLAPGSNWLTALESTLARCGAVAVCIGHEIGPWQQREIHAALDRQVADERLPGAAPFPVIPVLLPGGEPPVGFLRQNTWVDLREAAATERGLAILAKAARGEAPGPELLAGIEQAKAAVCPYRGLLYFREEDAGFFFGREAAVQTLVDTVERHPLVAVVGDSGSGKSSVVRAGLLPALRRRPASASWATATMVPGDRPLQRLAAALMPLLAPALSEVDRLVETKKLADAFETGAVPLRDVAERVLAQQPGSERLLLVVDQWEELFTLTESEPQRLAFITQLLQTTERGPVSAVLTLRGDYFGRAVTSQRALADRLQGAQVNLGPMTADELRRAITEPARLAGLAFEPNLVDLIVEQADAQPGHLPLLEFVLRELWEQRQCRTLHRAAYDAMGQLEGAIANRAEAAFTRMQQQDPQAEARLRAVFLRLVRPGEGAQDTRRRTLLSDLDEAGTALARQLASERLLVTSGDSTAPDQATLEVAHEALIAHWQRLRGWVQADRDFMTWRLRLDETMDAWEQSKRSADLLPRGIVLAQARDWANKRSAELSKREQEYISKGVKRRKLILGSIYLGINLAVLIAVYFTLSINQEKSLTGEARKLADNEHDIRLLAQSMLSNATKIRDIQNTAADLEMMFGRPEKAREILEQLRIKDRGLEYFCHTDQEFQLNKIERDIKIADHDSKKGDLQSAKIILEECLGQINRMQSLYPENATWPKQRAIVQQKMLGIKIQE